MNALLATEAVSGICYSRHKTDAASGICYSKHEVDQTVGTNGDVHTHTMHDILLPRVDDDGFCVAKLATRSFMLTRDGDDDFYV